MRSVVAAGAVARVSIELCVYDHPTLRVELREFGEVDRFYRRMANGAGVEEKPGQNKQWNA